MIPMIYLGPSKNQATPDRFHEGKRPHKSFIIIWFLLVHRVK